MTTQVAHADEVATQTPSVTEGNQYQPATAAEIFGGEAALPATPSSTVSAPVATSELAKPSAPAVSMSLAPQSSEAVTTAVSPPVANLYYCCRDFNFSNIFQLLVQKVQQLLQVRQVRKRQTAL